MHATIKPSVLLVEDDEDSYELMTILLRDRFDVYTARSVAQAKKYLQEQEIQLILLDLSLEGNEDGIHLTKYVRKSEPYKQIPIVVTTAHALTTDRENCLDAGCNEFITKPFRRERLMAAIDKYLAQGEK